MQDVQKKRRSNGVNTAVAPSPTNGSRNGAGAHLERHAVQPETGNRKLETVVKIMTRAGVPDIRTELPGPKTKVAIALDRRFTSPSYTPYIPLAAKQPSILTAEN